MLNVEWGGSLRGSGAVVLATLDARAARGEFREALECAWQSHRFGREGDGNDRADAASITNCVSSRFHRPPKAVALPPHSKVLRTKVSASTAGGTPAVPRLL